MIAILGFLWDLLVIGKLPWKKEELPTYPCMHSWGHWFLSDERQHYEHNNWWCSRTISRVCLVCGGFENKEYFTEKHAAATGAESAGIKLTEHLNNSILKPPAPPAPKPEPIKCDHEFSAWKIASRFLGIENGVIVLERYCIKCNGADKESYFTEKYNEDSEDSGANSNLIYQDLLLLEQSLNATILKES